MPIFCNGGPEKTLKTEYDRSPRCNSRGNNCTTFSVSSLAHREAGSFSGSRLVRMKHGASLFSMSFGRWPKPHPTAKIQNLSETTMLKAKKIILLSIFLLSAVSYDTLDSRGNHTCCPRH